VLFYNLPNSCIALLFGVTGAVLFAGTLFVRVKLLRIQIDPDPARRAHDALAVVIGFAGLILAFSLVQEQLDPEPGRQSLIYPEMLKKIDELTLARETRLVAAINIRLAPIFWESIVFLDASDTGGAIGK
jgi:hypothetical protein